MNARHHLTDSSKLPDMRRLFGLAMILGAVAASLSTVLAQQATRSANDGVYAPDQVKRGEALYASSCASCHDPALTGGIGPGLVGQDFISFWKDKTLAELYTRIKKDMPTTFPDSLSPEQAADSLAFVLSMNQFPAGAAPLTADAAVLNDIRVGEPSTSPGAVARTPDAAPAAPAAAAPPAGDAPPAAASGAGLYADVQVKRGEALYKNICVMCHGSNMRIGGVGPGLAGPRFVARWKDKGVAEIYDKIKTTMPQDAAGSLTPEQAADAVAFILSSNKYPGGGAELTAETAPQKTAPIGDPPAK
jgi:mono/diheme cytochrome c family protein